MTRSVPPDPFTPLAGWRLVPLPGGEGADVVDPAGHGWARVLGIGTQLDLRGRQVLPVLLPDGRETTLTNGTRWWGTRRHRTRGLLPLGPATYVLQHRTGRRARLLRDGVRLADLREDGRPAFSDLVRGRTRTPLVELRGPLGRDDQLALAVTGLVLQPGRPSALFRVVDALGTS